jgi:hypothetical protein
VVCFITMFVVIISGSVKSVYDDNAVVNKALTLVSFVFAGYVSIVINRWDRIRNATIGKINDHFHPGCFYLLPCKYLPRFCFCAGQMWGALENLNMISMSILVKQASPAEEAELSARLVRYSRLTMILTFKALQPGADADTLESLLIRPTTGTASVDTTQSASFQHSADSAAAGSAAAALAPAQQQELLTEEERQWLLAATPGNVCCSEGSTPACGFRTHVNFGDFQLPVL